MNKTIKIEVRNVYGRNTAYPVCETAQFFADLAGTKTLTTVALMLISTRGYSIEVIGRCAIVLPAERSERVLGLSLAS